MRGQLFFGDRLIAVFIGSAEHLAHALAAFLGNLFERDFAITILVEHLEQCFRIGTAAAESRATGTTRTTGTKRTPTPFESTFARAIGGTFFEARRQLFAVELAVLVLVSDAQQPLEQALFVGRHFVAGDRAVTVDVELFEQVTGGWLRDRRIGRLVLGRQHSWQRQQRAC